MSSNRSAVFALVAALSFLLGGSAVYVATRASNAPAAVSPEPAAPPGTWTLRSKHFAHGMPAAKDSRYNFAPAGSKAEVSGISVLVREGFVVGHCDRFKVPLWVAMRWTRQDLAASEAEPEHRRSFKADQELPAYAQGNPNYNSKGLKMDRGHMARNKDNTAWGDDNATMGDLMSNIAPQSPGLNQKAWLSLEDEHRTIVGRRDLGIDTIWIVAGTVFRNNQSEAQIGNGIGVPYATYKVICWFDSKGSFQARGYLFPQSADNRDSKRYLVTIRSIEEQTGLDFFAGLDRTEQDRVETRLPRSLWGSE